MSADGKTRRAGLDRRLQNGVGARLAPALLPPVLTHMLASPIAAFFRARTLLQGETRAGMLLVTASQVQMRQQWLNRREQHLSLAAPSSALPAQVTTLLRRPASPAIPAKIRWRVLAPKVSTGSSASRSTPTDSRARSAESWPVKPCGRCSSHVP